MKDRRDLNLRENKERLKKKGNKMRWPSRLFKERDLNQKKGGFLQKRI
jgi:hypothetical protein